MRKTKNVPIVFTIVMPFVGYWWYSSRIIINKLLRTVIGNRDCSYIIKFSKRICIVYNLLGKTVRKWRRSEKSYKKYIYVKLY